MNPNASIPSIPSAQARPTRGRQRPSQQRGVVLLFALIALVVMLMAGVALVRSFNTSLFTMGNLGFKRDLVNQAERAVPVVMTALATGTLSTEAARANHLVASNYSAAILPTNAQGIPIALIQDSAFAAWGNAGNDLTFNDRGVSIRYLIDRLCEIPGPIATLDDSKCNVSDNGRVISADTENITGAAQSANGSPGAAPLQVVYRLNIRVTGPRNTQSYFQTTFVL